MHRVKQARSIYGLLKGLAHKKPTPLEQQIRIGREETKEMKLKIRRKVAWQHASTIYDSFDEMLQKALIFNSVPRIRLILKRLLDEKARHGYPLGINLDLLRQCGSQLLEHMLERTYHKDEVLVDAVNILGEIEMWARDETKAYSELWTLVKAVACDIRGDRDLMELYLKDLAPNGVTFKLVNRILHLPYVSINLLNGLYEHLQSEIDFELFMSFYCSAMAHYPYNEIPLSMRSRMHASYETICGMLKDKNRHGSDVARSAIALVHCLAAKGEFSKVDHILQHFDSLLISAEWPMGTLAKAIRKLIEQSDIESASKLLEQSSSRNYRQFTQSLFAMENDKDVELRAALIHDELNIQQHMLPKIIECPSRVSLPMSAFFLPKKDPSLVNAKVADRFKQHYAEVGAILGSQKIIDASVVNRLVSEAGSWCFRLQSADPMIYLTQALISSISNISSDILGPLLTAYLRTLRNFGMLSFTTRMYAEKNKEFQASLHPLSSPFSTPDPTSYFDVLSTFKRTREAIITEYLRQGIEPSAEELAILQSHFACCGERYRSSSLASKILHLLPPNLTGTRTMGRLAIQAFYEQLMQEISKSSRWLLHLFSHIMTYHGVNDLDFRGRIVDQTVGLFMRHRHFVGNGFFKLEREFAKCVTRPYFTVAYVNRTLPRFWDLYMFLRRQKYVPRYWLRPRQLHVANQRIYVLHHTWVLGKRQIEKQNIDTQLEPVDPKDIDTAINIFLSSPPRTMPPPPRTVSWMIENQTEMIISSDS
ncbi:hypothetical protein IWW36_000923 [Coemansia brasiliensis]|uniref:Uncharacterized protein n=1 Tax=Coemansia brasiliensis TaxID=2650707 RepID=A0A9W8I9U7_9FUNG|nr:hypothetical protein IWW36_000923 [Coemansia brasiliensis]